MNSSSKLLCRLCLESSDGLVNIFEQFQDSTIASVLAKHFWFQDDNMPEWVCEMCWSQTKTFHHFYKRLELRHQNYFNSIGLVDEIKQERCVSPVEAAVEAFLFVDKCEEETDITIKTDDMQTPSMENSCDEDDDDNRGSQSEAKGSFDDDNEPSVDKPRRYNSISRSEIERQDAEIRKFFPMKCDFCSDVDFDTLKKMRKHYRQVHKVAKGYLVCCGNKYASRFLMMDHIQYHVNPDAHRCDQCDKRFASRNLLKTHMKCHIRAHKCSLCSKTFPSAAKLNYHVQDRHSADTSVKFPCDQCVKTFRTKLLLTIHIKNVHGQWPEHICEICGRKYKNKLNLQIHKELEHSTTPPPKVQCDICGTWLKHKGRLAAHLKLHQEMKDAQNGNAKALSCPICKKKVQNKRLLSVHIRCSHGERNYKCTLCDKAFKTSQGLKEHIAALHTGADLYSCAYCDRTFKSRANMYNHRKKVHLAEWTRDKAEKEICNQETPSETETTAKTVVDE
ncbi:transcription factor grauzone-like [Bradysia coprophila]|uniref:transcription factor grauzone-like n=1 Tax=Bradysia coprophila TaxID=38358 RepID=UPI00187D9C6C|nr:transcription factor grauzone-like [Bradysia coprophila]